MKTTLLFAFSMLCAGVYAQEHFSGINTSRRVGILNAAINPAEFANLKNDHEINFFAVSANVANNKITFGDLVKGKDLDNLIFTGSDASNLSGNAEILGPSFAMKSGKWGFGFTTAAKISINFVDIDVNLGNALTNSTSRFLLTGGSAPIDTDYNQRATATTWGEIGLSAARELYNDEEHRFTGGVTMKLIFPGAYVNMSADKFSGDIDFNPEDGNLYLSDASANINIAYSGSLSDDFEEVKNYTNFFSGGLNGFAADLGITYQWKNPEDGTTILNAGLSVRNLGGMTFKDDNNVSTNYILDVPAATEEELGLNLAAFDGASSVKDVEAILQQRPEYFTAINSNRDYRVNLPTIFSAYADVQVYNKWFVTAYTQQNLNEVSENDQIGSPNIITVTPRYSGDFFETYMPLSHNEISGFTAGLGFRLGGFFIGSGSVVTALVSEVEQADAYVGFRLGF